MDHYNSSSSSMKTTTDNSSSRFNFRNENYTGQYMKYHYTSFGCPGKFPQHFLQTVCPFSHATNSVKALKEAILSPGPYSK